ncbi:MAG: hypothetical protein RL417_2291 [Pseudomonadota bacterium]|jgi:predicted nucleic acid-binding protein
MKPLFIETSALLLHLVLRQSRAGEVRRALGDASRIVGSRLLKLELEQALLRLALDNRGEELLIHRLEGELRTFWSRVDLFEISEPICRHAGTIAPRSRLRALDAIHLATFLEAKRRIPALEMLSFEERIVAAL